MKGLLIALAILAAIGIPSVILIARSKAADTQSASPVSEVVPTTAPTLAQTSTSTPADSSAEGDLMAKKSPSPTTAPTATPTTGAVKYSGQPLPAPTMMIDKTKKYSAVLTTTAGTITVALNASSTPITVNNFVYLAKAGLYDNTIFHRVISGFMIQGGDPQGTGMGGPGYRFNDEQFTGEYKRGTIAMANAGPNTNGSQFFIMHADYALPKNYVIFGSVTKGLEVVDAIATAATKPGGEGSTPVTPVKVTSVQIVEN